MIIGTFFSHKLKKNCIFLKTTTSATSTLCIVLLTRVCGFHGYRPIPGAWVQHQDSAGESCGRREKTLHHHQQRVPFHVRRDLSLTLNLRPKKINLLATVLKT